jgi:hypothetical protein
LYSEQSIDLYTNIYYTYFWDVPDMENLFTGQTVLNSLSIYSDMLEQEASKEMRAVITHIAHALRICSLFQKGVINDEAATFSFAKVPWGMP